MIHPLNYTPKAIACMERTMKSMQPADRAGASYLVEKMKGAQVFVLPDHGQLLDRSKPSPVMPEVMFKPPFSVTAVEYAAPAGSAAMDPVYCAAASSKRIAVAWEWQDDLPPALRAWAPPNLPPGVVVASVSFIDQHRIWQPMMGAVHIPFEDGYQIKTQPTPYERGMIASRGGSLQQLAGPRLTGTAVPLLPGALALGSLTYGATAVHDALVADVMDEWNAYSDMCIALCCRNVSVDRRPASAALNKERRRGGKPLLKDMHVLKLGDAELAGTAMGGDRGRSEARAHLRRGHIRRLGPGRVTWVNQTMVRGHGFVDKVYAL